ncbi:MAG: hypothetical protein ACOYL6_16645 [Bacteriovoracaceae bacterium]
MKLFAILLLSAFVANAQANGENFGQGKGGETPFIASGDKISSLFQSIELWKHLRGQVKNIASTELQKGNTLFTITTIEYRNKSYMTCIVDAEVSDVSKDPLMAKWEVISTNFDKCPL